jgi:hypothetical protein
MSRNVQRHQLKFRMSCPSLLETMANKLREMHNFLSPMIALDEALILGWSSTSFSDVGSPFKLHVGEGSFIVFVSSPSVLEPLSLIQLECSDHLDVSRERIAWEKIPLEPDMLGAVERSSVQESLLVIVALVWQR